MHQWTLRDWLRGRFAFMMIAMLFLFGAGLILYPRAVEYVQERKETKLLTDWGDVASLRQGSTSVRTVDNGGKKLADASALPVWSTVGGVEVLGTVENERISLKEPIVRGADAAALKKGAGTVVEGRLPGQSGNFVLASHRSLTYGRHFNRLGEIVEGDTFAVNTSAGVFRYVVSSITVVEPDDSSVLADEPSASTLTLITCTPWKHPTHRLIVKANLQS
ncbi:class D sortase [Cohnella soli]|uniref:Class D sortase n=1 Tax=Cohnella soli TaxID=425005 RepID=A0ABW0HXS3_9BACL